MVEEGEGGEVAKRNWRGKRRARTKRRHTQNPKSSVKMVVMDPGPDDISNIKTSVLLFRTVWVLHGPGQTR